MTTLNYAFVLDGHVIDIHDVSDWERVEDGETTLFADLSELDRLAALADRYGPDVQITGCDGTVQIGWIDQNGTFEPPPVPPNPPKTVFSPRDFVALFAPAERTALFTARQTNVQIDEFITLAMAGPVDLTHAEVIADVNAVAQAGIITSGRAAQILAGTPAPS